MTDQKFWEERWKLGQTGWDLGSCHPGLPLFLSELKSLKAPRILVPGCGHGHEVHYLHAQGFDVVGYDVVPQAVEVAQKSYPELSIQCGDVLKLDLSQFDVIVDRAFLCALDERHRQTYVQKVRRELNKGALFLGIIFEQIDQKLVPAGPPFPLTRREIEEYFTGFERLALRSIADQSSVPAILSEFGCLLRKNQH